MTIEELIKELRYCLDSKQFTSDDKVKFRSLDRNGKVFHSVDYTVIHEDEPNTLILCEEWL